MKRTQKQANRKPYDMSMGVTQSMIMQFTRCRVASRLSLDGWGSAAPKRATQFGSLFHALLENWYAGSIEQRTLADEPLKVFQEVAKKWEVSAAKAGDDVRCVQADLAVAKVLFPAYVSRYAKEDGKKKWVEVEQVFSEPWEYDDGLVIPLRGKVDGAFEAKDGSLWALETKTAAQISDETLSLALAFDFQCLFYLFTLGQKLERKFSGVLYNIIRTPSIGKNEDRSSEEFVTKLSDDLESRKDFYFVRYELAFPKGVRERFFADLEHKMDEFRMWMEGKLPTYRNENTCRGKWNCEYLPVCAAGGDPVKAGFKQNKILFRELIEE